MKISMKTDYGVRAILDLAQRYGQGPIQSAEIAARQSIPEAYLDQLLMTLRKAGLVRSLRGPQGGHSLAKQPDQMTLGEVVVALEGALTPIDCLDKSDECYLSKTCAVRDVWQEVKNLTQNILDSTTIEKLAQRQLAREEQVMYYI